MTAFVDMEAPSPLFRVARYHYEGRDRAQFWFTCPGCGEAHAIGDNWQFNGDFDRPTFSPSFKTWLDPNPAATREPYISGFVCHSFIRDGKIEYCGGSTHTLAGQTVAMVPFDMDRI